MVKNIPKLLPMKNKIVLNQVFIFTIFLTFLHSCTFPDLRTLATITSSEAKYITPISATIDCNITNGGDAYISERGVCYSKNPTPTIESTVVKQNEWALNFTIYITCLEVKTKYYARAFAINEKGTAYSEEISFTTKNWEIGSLSDFDGNTYRTFKISDLDQTWMQENLKVTHFSNGDQLLHVQNPTDWKNLKTGAYCVLPNFSDYKEIYGLLYNAYVVEDNRNICPTGWHVPNEAEWQVFSDYLGGDEVSGGKMKESGKTHWISPNTSADNSSGFTGLPGSSRLEDGYFLDAALGNYGQWWSATSTNNLEMYGHALSYLYGSKSKGQVSKNYGRSIRCIKDKS